MHGIELWRKFADAHESALLEALLHPDVVFESPVVHTPQRGVDIVTKYLVSAVDVLGGEGFRYLREWRSDRGVVLEFESEIEGVRINGVDIISFTEDERQIIHMKVMIRPLKAIHLVHRMMGERLSMA